MSGLIPAGSKLKNGAGPAAAGLDVVDDQQDVVAAADLGEAAHPFEARHVQPAFALQGLDDDRRRAVEARAGVAQHAVEKAERIEPFAHEAVVRHRGAVAERDARAGALERVGGQRQRPQGHAVEAVGEAEDAAAPGHLAGELERGLDRVGAGRPGEGDAIVHPARGENHLGEAFQEPRLGRGCHVEAMGDAVVADVLDQLRLHVVRVVAVVQAAGTGEEVDEFAPVLGPDAVALGAGEHGGEVTAVTTHVQFVAVEGLMDGGCFWHACLLAWGRGPGSGRAGAEAPGVCERKYVSHRDAPRWPRGFPRASVRAVSVR